MLCLQLIAVSWLNHFSALRNDGRRLASSVSTYFSTHLSTFPHNLIKEKVTELFQQTFSRDGSLDLASNKKTYLFTSEQPKQYNLWSCQRVCDAVLYLLDTILIRFGSKLYRQKVGIPTVTNCVPFGADLLLFLLLGRLHTASFC